MNDVTAKQAGAPVILCRCSAPLFMCEDKELLYMAGRIKSFDYSYIHECVHCTCCYRDTIGALQASPQQVVRGVTRMGVRGSF